MGSKVEPVPMCVMLIANNLSRFTDTKRKAAEYLLKNYKSILKLNVNELAAESRSSPSTIIRLCNELGYKRYQDFKIALAQEISNPTYQIAEALEKDDDITTIIGKTFQSNIEAIGSTLSVLDIAEFKKAVRLIVSSRRLECYAFGGSAPIALDAAHKFLKIGRKTAAVSDPDIQAMSASLLAKGDAVLAVSHSGRNKDLLANLDIAQRAGASVIAITSNSKNPIHKYADSVLCTSAKETAFKSDALSSRIAQLTIIDALFVAVAFKTYDESNKNISRTRSATVGNKRPNDA